MTIPTQNELRAMPVASAALLTMQGQTQQVKTLALIDALARVNPHLADSLPLLREALIEDDADNVEVALDMFSREASEAIAENLREYDLTDDAYEAKVSDELHAMAAE